MVVAWMDPAVCTYIQIPVPSMDTKYITYPPYQMRSAESTRGVTL